MYQDRRKKRRLTVRLTNGPYHQKRKHRPLLLVLLSVYEIVSKNAVFTCRKGATPSKADAKVLLSTETAKQREGKIILLTYFQCSKGKNNNKIKNTPYYNISSKIFVLAEGLQSFPSADGNEFLRFVIVETSVAYHLDIDKDVWFHQLSHQDRVLAYHQ